VPLSPDSLLVAAAAGASFLTGLGGSGHCAVMCGPLASVGLTGSRDGSARHSPAPSRRSDRNHGRVPWTSRDDSTGHSPAPSTRIALAWQAARLAAYGGVGAVLGALGHAGLALTRGPFARALPWVMVAGLVLSAAEVGRRLPALPGLAHIPRALARLGARFSPTARAAIRGAATPCLPCGLLYGAFVVALGTGTATAGGLIMLAFALGAVPALGLVQFGAPLLARTGARSPILRRAVPLIAAALVAWRALGTHGAGPPHCH
jgi:uncharacterized protein